MMTDRHFWGGLIAFGAVSLVFFIGWWTHASNENFRICLEAGGSYIYNGRCVIK